MIRRIKFTEVKAADQARALAFYTQKLGMTVHTDAEIGNDRWIELDIPGAETKLVLSKGTPQDGRPALVFETDDVQKAFDDLKGKGVQFTTGVEQAPWGTHAMFKDSEGNLILLSQDPRPVHPSP